MTGTHARNVLPMQAAQRCGARTRAGTACCAPAVVGGKRCRMHGGKGSGAPKDNQNARKHGLYDRDMQARRGVQRLLKAEVRAALAVLEGKCTKSHE